MYTLKKVVSNNKEEVFLVPFKRENYDLEKSAKFIVRKIEQKGIRQPSDNPAQEAWNKVCNHLLQDVLRIFIFKSRATKSMISLNELVTYLDFNNAWELSNAQDVPEPIKKGLNRFIKMIPLFNEHDFYNQEESVVEYYESLSEQLKQELIELFKTV